MGNTVISSTLLPIYAGLQIQPSGSDPAVGVFDSHTPPPYLPWSSFRIIPLVGTNGALLY